MLKGKRVLATLATIQAIRPIPNADSIEVGTVRGGWDVVVQKDEFHDGDPVVYIEPDAALPLDNPDFAFLAARGVKTIDGRDYHVLKTARLRGQLSQGIVFPIHVFSAALSQEDIRYAGLDPAEYTLDKQFGIILYEPAPPVADADRAGPWNLTWLKKTDAERVQNLSDKWLQSVNDGHWVATEKIDGSSLTMVLDESEELRIYSRNMELKTDNPNSTPMRLAREYQVAEWMREHGVTAVQGEMFGPGIQSNRLAQSTQRFAVFAAWTRDGWTATDRFQLLMDDPWMLTPAPVLTDVPFPKTVREAIDLADNRRSVVNPDKMAEGIVWHHVGDAYYPELDERLVFKSVSPSFLLKDKN